jgi:hypothetical protein
MIQSLIDAIVFLVVEIRLAWVMRKVNGNEK